MSNRALIGRKNADGSVDYVQCIFDGYLAHTGMMLEYYWASEERIDELLAGGKMSSLGPELGVAHDGSLYPSAPGTEEYTIFYHRDRKQPYQETRSEKAATVGEFLGVGYPSQTAVQHRYLFQDGKWFYARTDKLNLSPLELVPIRAAILAPSAELCIRSNDENGYVLEVILNENPKDWEETGPPLSEFVDFLDSAAGESGWHFILSKRNDNVRILVKNDAAVVAMRLRYDIEDHEDRLVDEAAS
jgi:hypothetical protein